MAKETEAHKRYMKKYNERKYRESIASSVLIASPPTSTRRNWVAFYTNLYIKLGIEQFLPAVLKDLEASKSS